MSIQHSAIFDPNDLQALRTHLSLMQTDIRLQYQQSLNESHHRLPTVIEPVHTGRRGRPSIDIDSHFLQWAYAHRSTSGIGRFSSVSRTTVRNALLRYGIAEPQTNPFASTSSSNIAGTTLPQSGDKLLDPSLPLPNEHADVLVQMPLASESDPQITSFTGPLSMLTNDELDHLILQLWRHFRRGVYSVPGPNSLRHHDGQHGAF